MSNNIEYFKQLGLTEYESRLYITLVQQGAVTGYRASKLSGVPKANCYAALNSLVQKGYVYKIESDSVLFYARDFSEIKQRIEREVQEKLIYLDKNLKNICQQNQQFTNIEGNKNIKDKIISLISSSKESVYLDIYKQDLLELLPYFKQAKNRLVNCVVICIGQLSDEDKKAVNYCLEHELGNWQQQRDFNLIVDKKYAFSGHIENKYSNAVYSANTSFVNLTNQAFKHDLYNEIVKSTLLQQNILNEVQKQLNKILKE